MILFTKLLIAHLVGDFLLQPKRWVVHKEVHKIRSRYIYFHTLIHFLLLMLLVMDLDFWPWALAISLSHYIIDLSKLYTLHWYRWVGIPFLIDQLLHIAILAYVAFYGQWLETWEIFYQLIDWPLILSIVFVTYPAAIIMSGLLEGMAKKIPVDHKSLPNAGKYIGILERLFVLLFIILGRWEGIGLLITAKSVFRFNDLKERNNRKLTEYILIGTLLSFGLAILAGLAYLYLGNF